MGNFYNAFMNTRINGLISPHYDYSMPLTVAIALLVLCAAAAYLLGSINFAILVSKHKYKEDIRSYGSGNGGMTNMMRTYGRKSAAITFAGDPGQGVSLGNHRLPAHGHFRRVYCGVILYYRPLLPCLLSL